MGVAQDQPIPSFTQVACGEVSGSVAAKQLPDVQVLPGMVYLKAATDNAGKVYVGGAGVTKPDGTQDTTSGYPLAAGDSMGPLVISNLSKLYIVCDNAGDDLLYLVTQ